jgi:RNA recognition motif-containing protein
MGGTLLKLYVGNLSFEAQDETLRAAFASYGEVSSATVIMDRTTGHSRGFGFVEMPSQTEAQAAMSALNGSSLDGRALTVNEAKERAPRDAGYSRGPARQSW